MKRAEDPYDTVAPTTDESEPAVFPLGSPRQIGRYQVVRLLGKGGFGRVYLARDLELDRPVAIKVPDPARISSAKDLEVYFDEAKILARLEHPSIVPVYDIGRTDDGLCYVVSKFLEGSDLAVKIRQDRPGFLQSAELIANVAAALHYAHTKGLVHRDVKPANILIDAGGKPCVADFGLALKDENFGKAARLAGTPAYMSPEQARGEGHRVDGRSDIFSLGVVLFELLTGTRPFIGPSIGDVLDHIKNSDARPPRQIDDRIPKALERICLKALSKRATERYTTAWDMAEDLREFLKTAENGLPPTAPSRPVVNPRGSTLEDDSAPTTSKQPDSDESPIKIIPKGLRSFDERDADFFLELLAGPRDRNGLPESIRFWKSRVEEVDRNKTFRVGLIYGPSGCGKSSMVKAGLLPRLANQILPVYIDAAPEDTENRILMALRTSCSTMVDGLGLVDALTAVRRARILRPGQKLLLIIDQFEQWLHAKGRERGTELVAALRQCDGEHSQALILVRDDFWMAVTRFMSDLEIDLFPDQNVHAVDLFDSQHALKVLVAFGIAYGKLAERNIDVAPDQRDFLHRAIDELAVDGSVISVRLALFAEMVKGKPWIPTTLRDVGGIEGLGITFLEETFGSPRANPKHRVHQKSAQAALKALLPESGSDIKGQMRSTTELQNASGYADRPREFAELLHILDSELRLITPTDGAGIDDAEPTDSLDGRYYQLTHDYLVPSLRDWLSRKQRGTRRGRAELRLAERSSIWNAKPENRHLPSAMEWANIRLLTRKKDWTYSQRRMIKRAGRVYRFRALILSTVLILLSGAGYEVNGRLRAQVLRDRLLASPLSDVPGIIAELKPYRRWVDPLLRQIRTDPDGAGNPSKQLNAAIALFPADSAQMPYLTDRMLHAHSNEISVILMSLTGYTNGLVADCWRILEKPTQEDQGKSLQAACALARYDPKNPRWSNIRDDVANRLVAENAYGVASWIDALLPVANQLRDPLVAIFHDDKRGESERTLAASALAEYLDDQPRVLTKLLMDAIEKQFGALYPAVEKQSAQTGPLLDFEVARNRPAPIGREPTEVDQEAWDRFYKQQANAAVALIRLGRLEKSWLVLKHNPDPSLRNYLVHRLGSLGIEPSLVIGRLERETDNSVRRALILSLGEYGESSLSAPERDVFAKKLLDLYRNDPDPGIHGAADWLLRHWRKENHVREMDKDLAKLSPPTLGPERGVASSQKHSREWYVNSQSQTMVIIRGPVEFDAGKKTSRLDFEMGEAERQRRERIDHSFAIATKEVTIEQYEKFFSESANSHGQNEIPYSADPTRPMEGVSWYSAAAYCNWLSKQDGLAEDQWCYPRNDKGAFAEGMEPWPDAQKRAGYRLPTEAEWEYSCNALAITTYSFGEPWGLLAKYGWYSGNSSMHSQPVGSLKPNDLGLFDLHGNVWEWCQDKWSMNQGKSDRYTESLKKRYAGAGFIRGGAFDLGAVGSATHAAHARVSSYASFGFRPCRTYR